MKYPFSVLAVVSVVALLFSCHRATAPEAKVQIDPEAFLPPYELVTPKDWTTEKFGIPIEFAPSIPYSGIEICASHQVGAILQVKTTGHIPISGT